MDINHEGTAANVAESSESPAAEGQGESVENSEQDEHVHEHVHEDENESASAEAVLRRELLGHLLEHWYAQDDIIRVAILSTRYEDAVGNARAEVSQIFEENADDLGEAFHVASELLENRDDLTDNERRYVMTSSLREHAPAEAMHRSHKAYSASAFARVRDRRKNLGLLSAQLIALVADFELFVLRVTSSWLEYDSSHLADRSKQMSYRDISQYDSLDELKESIVNSFLEEHMRKSAVAWFDEFSKLFNDAKIQGADQETTLEAFQRRHVIVHHGGVVSRQYLAALQKFKPKVKLGDELHVDRRYIREAATALASVAHSIVMAALIASTAKSPDERAHVEREAGELTYILLTLGRPKVVDTFSSHFDLRRVQRGWSREQLRVNGWIAKRRLKKLDSVLPQIEAWDVSGAADDFKLAKDVLLGRNEAAVRRAVRMINEGRLTAYSVASWPLFETMRTEIFEALEPTPIQDSSLIDDGSGPSKAIEEGLATGPEAASEPPRQDHATGD